MESADPENTMLQEKRKKAIPRLMNPYCFLPHTNWRGTTMLGVVKDNTRLSRNPVLDQLTRDEGVFFLRKTFDWP